MVFGIALAWVLLIGSVSLFGIASLMFIKESINFLKLVKKRDGYYLVKWLI